MPLPSLKSSVILAPPEPLTVNLRLRNNDSLSATGVNDEGVAQQE